jgi:hypothetical protein
MGLLHRCGRARSSRDWWRSSSTRFAAASRAIDICGHHRPVGDGTSGRHRVRRPRSRVARATCDRGGAPAVELGPCPTTDARDSRAAATSWHLAETAVAAASGLVVVALVPVWLVGVLVLSVPGSDGWPWAVATSGAGRSRRRWPIAWRARRPAADPPGRAGGASAAVQPTAIGWLRRWCCRSARCRV